MGQNTRVIKHIETGWGTQNLKSKGMAGVLAPDYEKIVVSTEKYLGLWRG
jgi:hypothetical protein